MWQMKWKLFYHRNVGFLLNYVIGVPSNTSSFCVYTLAVLSEIGNIEHIERVVSLWYRR